MAFAHYGTQFVFICFIRSLYRGQIAFANVQLGHDLLTEHDQIFCVTNWFDCSFRYKGYVTYLNSRQICIEEKVPTSLISKIFSRQ